MIKESGIYCFENIITHQKYVGQSQSLDERIKEHIRKLRIGIDSSLILQNAWNKYKEENFIFYVLENCPIDLLGEKEMFYIKFLHSNKSENGYNISWGGEYTMRGLKHSEETRRKMSISQKNRIIPPEEMERKKIMFRRVGQSNKGKTISEEAKQKIRESMPDRRGKNNPLFGKPLSEEHRRKLSKARIGRQRSEETCRKLGEARKAFCAAHPKPITHGSSSGYRRGCRCVDCLKAKSTKGYKKIGSITLSGTSKIDANN